MIAFVFVASLSALIGASELDRLLDEAVALRAKGDLVATLEKLRAAEKIRPHFRISHNIAVVLEDLGRYGEADVAYRAVIADRAAPADVVEGDRARAEALAPKLVKAWIVVHASSDAEVLLDGVRIEPGIETGVEPRARMRPPVIEVWRGDVLALVAVPLVTATRTDLELASPSRSAFAVLILDRPLLVDGHPVRAAREIWLQPGSHAFEVERRSVTASLAAGSETRLVALFPEVTVQETRPLVLQPPERDRTVTWILGGAGLAAAVAGTVLLISGDADRASVHDAAREDEIITGVSMRDAASFESSARTKTLAGGLALGGAAALVAIAALLFAAD